MPFVFHANAFITYFLLLIFVIKSRFAAYILLPIIFFSQGLAYYVSTRYGICTTEALVFSALGTNWEEIKPFILPRHYVLVPLGIALCYAAIFLMRKFCHGLPISVRAAALSFFSYSVLTSCMLLAAVNFFPETSSYLVYSRQETIPRNISSYRTLLVHRMRTDTAQEYIYRLYLPFYRQCSAIGNVYRYYNPSPLIPSQQAESQTVFSDKDLIVVLFIGESFRADHSPWNGYKETFCRKPHGTAVPLSTFPG